jgi:hypothetical protein
LEQEIDFFENVDFDKKITICKKCKKEIDRLKMGRWVPQKPENKEIHGYKVSGIYNARRSVADLVDSYMKAKESGFSFMQQFYNQVLGLPYEIEGTKVLVTELNNCRSDYETPLQVTNCVAGADVGTKIHVIIGQMNGDKLRYVWIGSVNNFLGPTDSIEYLMDKYKINPLVIDAKPETRKVKELIEKYPQRVFAAYYPTKQFDVQNYYIYDDIKSEVKLDRTISLDYLVSDIHNEMVEIPRNAQYIPGFYDHMTSSMRVTEINNRTGQPVTKWVETGSDHYFHAANYLRLAKLKGAIAQALLDSYKEPKEKKDFAPESLAGWARWVRLKGKKIF